MAPSPLNIENIAVELNELGLGRDLARLYVALLRNGRSPASTLAKVAGIHRVDTYKKLNELTKLGFIKLILGRPTIYEAVEPKSVLESLINSKRNEFDRLVNSRAKLEPKLRALSSNPISETAYSSQAYQLIVGRRQGYNMIERVLRSAKHDIMRTSSPNGLRRNYKYKLLNEFVGCARRGLSVRIITNVDQLPKKIVNILQSSIELRHSPEPSLPYIIIDGETLVFSGQFNENEMSLDSRSARYILIRDEKFANLFAVAFKQSWDSAKPS